MSTLVSYNFPGPLVHLPPRQPSHHKVLSSVTQKNLEKHGAQPGPVTSDTCCMQCVPSDGNERDWSHV